MKASDLKKLREKLPRGYGEKLKAITGKSVSAVYKTLAGEINSPEILEAAIALAKETKAKSSNQANAIKSL